MANAFESGERKVIPAVLVYLQKGDEFLMIHRGSRPGDFHSGMWNGLGGKCDEDESSLETARREVQEESGLEVPLDLFKSMGVLQFPNFKPHKAEDWMVFVFRADVSNISMKSLVTESEEGSLHWVSESKLTELNLWEGDRIFLPWVLSARPFLGTFWYQDRKLDRHWITGI